MRAEKHTQDHEKKSDGHEHHHASHSDHDHSDHNGHSNHDHQGHHAHMVADFRRRFWISTILTIPVLILAPLIQSFLGL
jgi:Cu2+-exporting ATPase